MICPYSVNRKIKTRTRISYDENGYHTDTAQIEESKITYPECQEENCGAWHDGECRYNGK